MNRTVKRILAIFAVIIALLAALMLFFAITFDANDYKQKITAQVKANTGRELIIQDDISLSFFPWIGIKLGATQLSNPEGFANEPFASIESVAIRIKFMPLLQGQTKIDTVSLEGLQLKLISNKKGKNNWTFSPPETNETNAHQTNQLNSKHSTPDSSAATTAEPQALTALSENLSINGLQIINTNISWRDDFNHSEYTLENFNLNTNAIKIGKATEIDFHATLSGTDLPEKGIEIETHASLAANLESQSLTIQDMTLQAMGLIINSNINIKQLMVNPVISGTLKLPDFNPRQLLSALEIAPPETNDPSVLSSATLSLKFNADNKNIALKNIQLRLDETSIDGKLTIENASTLSPAINYALTIDQINLDRYLPPTANEQQQANAASVAGAAVAPVIALPTEQLRALNLKGTTRINALQLSNLKITNINVTTKAADGNIRLHPLKASLYDGLYNGDIRLDVRQDIPRYNLDEQLKNFNIQAFLQDLLQKDLIAGQADLQFSLSTHGITTAELTRALNGNGRFSFANGAVKGINVAQMIREAKAKIEKKPAPADSGKNTDFTAFKGSFNIKNGVVNNDDLNAQSPYLRVTGKGQADLTQEQLDYRLQAKIVDTSKGQDGEGLISLKGITIPIKIKGAFADPSIKLDSAAIRNILRSKAKKAVQQKVEKKKIELNNKLEEEKQKARQELEDKLKQKLKDKLKGLF